MSIHRRAWAALLVIAVSLPACDMLELKGGRSPDEAYRGATTWPFVPVAMRVYPFTAIEFDDQRDAVVLDLKVEMTDRVGDPTKAVGDYHVALYRISDGADAATAEGDLVSVWDIPVTELDQNTQHYNPTLRTYDFKLRMASMPDPDDRMRVVVQFTDPGGTRMRAEAIVGPAAEEPASGDDD